MVFLSSLYILTAVTLAESFEVKCPAAVLGRYGERAELDCKFPDNSDIYWYDQHDGKEPLLRLEGSQGSGRGLDSGEYNISDTGALYINDADWHHEQTYEVFVIQNSETGESQVDFKLWTGCQTSYVGWIGQSATLGCDFRPHFIGIYWYDEREKKEPLIRLESDFISGRGYDSRDYNITNNGSLIINRVSSAQNYSFYVIGGDLTESSSGVQLNVEGEESTTRNSSTDTKDRDKTDQSTTRKSSTVTEGSDEAITGTLQDAKTTEPQTDEFRKTTTKETEDNEPPAQPTDRETTTQGNVIIPHTDLGTSNWLKIGLPVVAGVILIVSVIVFWWRYRKQRAPESNGNIQFNDNKEAVPMNPVKNSSENEGRAENGLLPDK